MKVGIGHRAPKPLRTRRTTINAVCSAAAIALIAVAGCAQRGSSSEQQTVPMSESVADGQRIFRFDTFGDEQFWTDKARLNEVIEQQLQPLEALSLGLKVDLDNLNLLRFVFHNPFAVSGTKELLRQNAVVGVQATFDKDGNIARVGITCAPVPLNSRQCAASRTRP